MNGAAQQPVFLIFEGGGAKGIAHLGALRAVEELGYPIVGVGGASAGSFVAALAAAGYRSDELLTDASKTSNLLARKELNPIDLFGVDSWADMVRGIDTARHIMSGGMARRVFRAGVAMPRNIGLLRRLMRQQGQFTTEKVRDFVNDCIYERLCDLYANQGRSVDDVPAQVAFKDLDPGRFPELRPLKIIATNIDAGEGVLFDLASTPNVLIGDAVAASIAIPIVFQPTRVRQWDPEQPGQLTHLPGRFADGGLVSNLPSWVFNEERLALQRATQHSRPIPILAFSLTPVADAKRPPDADQNNGFFELIARVARTAVSGSQAIAGRLLVDLEVIELPIALKLLAFDANWIEIRAAYLAGRNYAKQQMRQRLELRPGAIREALHATLDTMRTEVNLKRKEQGKGPVEHMRACRIEPYGLKSLRVSHGVNMDDDADDRLPLDREAKIGAAEAMRAKNLQVLKVGTGQPLPSPMTKYERAWIRRDLRSALCIPIFRDLNMWNQRADQRPTPLGVLSIDSDEDLTLEFQELDVQRAGLRHSVVLSATFVTDGGRP